MSEPENKILNHSYDGIEEYDNPLPSWWVNLYVLTVIIGIGYFVWMHMVEDGGKTTTENYHAELLAFKAEQKKLMGGDDAKERFFQKGETFVADMSTDVLSKGKKIYMTNCLACHKEDGGGSVGPNLTDKYWLHGGDFTSVVWTIVDGVPENGMIAWKPILKKMDILAVSSFVKSLSGNNVEGGKAPQGTAFEGTN